MVVGSLDDLPMSINELKAIDQSSRWVVESFESGLTAIVYHLNIDGMSYNLKKKRPESLVKNVDGQTSFLNEIQRRQTFEELRLKNSIIDQGIVKTIYANYREGIIVSEWIEGGFIEDINEALLDQLFRLTLEMEKQGIMEWDLCKGNILISKDGWVKLFDFGYAYTYDPRKAFNSEGLKVPLFNSVERFETRFFMPYLLDLHINEDEKIMTLYKVVKKSAIKIYKEKEAWLRAIQADPILLEVCKDQLKKWEDAIKDKNSLKNLYKLESMRSYVLDIHDDLMGKSCSPTTLRKVDKVLDMLETDYDFIKKHDGFLWNDVGLSQQALVNKYQEIRSKVLSYQIKKS
jgi:hypothetical protein